MRHLALGASCALAFALGCNGNGSPVGSKGSTVAAIKQIPTPPTAKPTAPVSSTATPTTPATPAKPVAAAFVRPDIFNGTSVAPAPVNSSTPTYGWASVEGVTFHVSIDTQPSGKSVKLLLRETDKRGTNTLNTLFDKLVTTPFTGDFKATTDSYTTSVM
jgi:hypothetical protein